MSLGQRLSKLGHFLFALTPWLTLGILLFYTFAWFIAFPHPGFSYDPSGVVDVFVGPELGQALRPGDELLRVGDVTLEDRLNSRTAVWFAGYAPGDTVQIEILRDDRRQVILWTIPPLSPEIFWDRATNTWWLGYIFWLGGLVIFLFVRPRDLTWRLLIWFHFLMAVFLGTGMLALHNVTGSAVVYPVSIWLLALVTLHLHWVFPSPLTRLPRWFRPLWYGLALALVVMEVTGPIRRGSQLPWLYLALAASLFIVLLRVVRRRDRDAGTGWLLVAIALLVLPNLLYTIFISRGEAPPRLATGLGFLSLPVLPGAYFYLANRAQLLPYQQQVRRAAVAYGVSMLLGYVFFGAISQLPDYAEGYRAQGALLVFLLSLMTALGISPFLYLPALFRASTGVHIPGITRFQVRPNRLVGPYLFLLLTGSLLVVIAVLLRDWLLQPGLGVAVSVGLALLALLLAQLSYRRFCTLVERRLLGIPVAPDLVATFAVELSTSPETGHLTSLLTQRILPNLLVRQSALITLREEGSPTVLYAQGFTPEAREQLGQRRYIEELAAAVERPSHLRPDHTWAHLIAPLRYQDRLIGLWLLGRRDPDDYYDPETIVQCQALAEQMAIALVNIEQARRLHQLAQANLERHEAERRALARTLHDEVLSRLAVAAMYSDDAVDSPAGPVYDEIAARLRQIVGDLRPAMLTYGLRSAIEEMLEDLRARVGDRPRLILDVPESAERHPDRVEEYLFRIVQQGIENALRHAKAGEIRVAGTITAGGIELSVADDGEGFVVGEEVDLSSLLAEGHYGLAGMFERANLLNARLTIDAAPGAGTRVTVRWEARGQREQGSYGAGEQGTGER